MMIVVMGVGIAAWAFGKTQGESSSTGDGRASGGGYNGARNAPGADAASGANRTSPGGGANGYTSPGGGGNPFNTGSKPNTTNNSWSQRSQPPPTSTAWEKAREETKRREDERRAAEDQRKKKDEAEKKAREAAEKEKWEKARARERETREREAREKLVRERLAKEKEQREADAREREARDKSRRMPTSSRSEAGGSPTKKAYERPTAKSYVGTDEDAHSFRPYDTPKKQPVKTASQSSMYSESSYAPSQTTARTTPPPSNRGPFSTKDPDKIVIQAVYLFNNLFPKPAAQLVSGVGSVTDGLVLRITTEGMFVDDEVRGVGQREWDVKAWGLKLVEVRFCIPFSISSFLKFCSLCFYFLLCATRDYVLTCCVHKSVLFLTRTMADINTGLSPRQAS
jgi:hypothetical protein